MVIRTISDEMKRRYGTKVYRLSLSSGCSCPNRDGRLGYGGCTFCSEGGSGDFASPVLSVEDQLEYAKRKVGRKISSGIPESDRKYIAYFQSFTNTYGDPERLGKLYAETLARPEIVALSLGTRPDCLPDEILDMLVSLKQTYRKEIWIELGLQTMHDKTAGRINRGYPLSVFEQAFQVLKEKGFSVIIHIIYGLPGETREDMLDTVTYLSNLHPHPDGVKLQLLHILRGTKMAEEYEKKPFHILSMDEYIDLIVTSLQILPEDVVIHRMTGDGPKKLLIEPLWSADKKRVLNALNKAIKDMTNRTEVIMEYRIEHDSMGEVKVPADRLWGAQTERSHENFPIGVGIETMPAEIIHAFGILKKAAAQANHALVPERMTDEKLEVIKKACDEVIAGNLMEEFPLVVWQTGSGTQSNMNSNEVIANRANQLAGKKLCHPNDDINMSQSSNDTFPTAMHIAAVISIEDKLIPAIETLITTFRKIEAENPDVVKSGRTHLQDATPVKFAQEVSGWRSSLEKDVELLRMAAGPLRQLALGGTAVGTGLNTPKGFDVRVAKEVADITGKDFVTADNKFHALTSKDELVYAHGAVKATAADMMKIANDVRWLASGPRLGLGEITIPANEPGSSIMPGKVNPTQCEQVTMVAVQIMGNDVAVGMAATQGNFELNVFMPVLIYNFLQSVRLLAESIMAFNNNCAVGIKVNEEKMHHNLHNSLMLVTALNPYIGYENAAKVAHKAFDENTSLKEACVSLGFLTAERFDEVFHPEEMV